MEKLSRHRIDKDIGHIDYGDDIPIPKLYNHTLIDLSARKAYLFGYTVHVCIENQGSVNFVNVFQLNYSDVEKLSHKISTHNRAHLDEDPKLIKQTNQVFSYQLRAQHGK